MRPEKVEPLPSQAPVNHRLQEIVGQACEARRRAGWGDGSHLAESTVRAIESRPGFGRPL
jgi:hypothetical protein